MHRHKALKLGRGRIFRPLRDIYNRDEATSPADAEPEEAYDLWSVAREGNVSLLLAELDDLQRRAQKTHDFHTLRRQSRENTASLTASSKINPSTLVRACPCDAGSELREVALDQFAWYCVTCSNNQQGFTICCLWCSKRCHAGHILDMTDEKLVMCECGRERHEPAKRADPSSPLDTQDSTGSTALFYAAHEGQLEMVGSLLMKGASPAALNLNGMNALHGACLAEELDTARFLLTQGVPVNQRDLSNHLSPLHVACKHGSTSIARLLMERKANVNVKTKMGQTALMMAAQRGTGLLVELLLKHKAHINPTNIEGKTALDIAIRQGNRDCLVVLLLYGAKLKFKSKTGKTLMGTMMRPRRKRRSKNVVTSRDNGSVIKVTKDALFRCACFLDDVRLLHDVMSYFRLDIDEALSPYQSDSGMEFDRTVFQDVETLPIFAALSAVKIHGKVGVVTKLFQNQVNIFRPEEGLPFYLLQCTCLEVHYNLIEHYSHGSKFRGTMLRLSDCMLPSLPLPFLEALNVYNAMTPDKPVTVLELQDNLLDRVAPELAQVPHLRDVVLEGNPLTLMSWMAGKDWNAIKSYLSRLEARASQWNSCRVILLGDRATGKSTVAECLRKRKGTSPCKMLPKGTSVFPDVNLNKGSGVQFTIWDLGEDEVQFGTHKFFLSTRAIYLITFDLPASLKAKEEEDYSFLHRIGFWLQEVRSLTQFSQARIPVVLVGTREDQVNLSSDEKANLIELIRRHFPREIFYCLKDILLVSCKTGLNVDELKQTLISFVEERSDFLPMVPESWVRLHDLVMSLRTAPRKLGDRKHSTSGGRRTDLVSSSVDTHNHDSDIITWEMFTRFAHQCQVDDVPAATEFLQDEGVVVQFRHFFHSNLDNLVIINPHWISRMMGVLIALRHTTLTKGFLPFDELPRVFKDFPGSLYSAILDLLRDYRIAYDLESSKLKEVDEAPCCGAFLPCLLAADIRYNTVIMHWPPQCPSTYVEQGRIYRFQYPPLNLFDGVMESILQLQHVQAPLVWRYGLIIEADYVAAVDGQGEQPAKQRAYVVFTRNLELCIRVRTPRAQRFGESLLLRSIINAVEVQVENTKTSVKRVVPCSHCIIKRGSTVTPTEQRRGTRCTDFLSWNSHEGVFEFTMQECVNALLMNERSLYCNHIKSPSRRVRLIELAPDLALSHIPFIQKSQLKVGEELGSGAFGTVYRGRLKVPGGNNSVDVAVKRLREDGSHFSVDTFLEFQAEIQVMAAVKNANVVAMCGITIDPLQIVLELVPHGDLFQLLHPPVGNNPTGASGSSLSLIPDQEFSWRERLLISLDIARGLHALQSQEPPILHRDIRSANIFLRSRSLDPLEIRAKVADFGLARAMSSKMSGTLETWRWLAPEVIDPSTSYDIKSDTYSFAIVLWEIGSRCYPFDEFYSSESMTYLSANHKTRLLNEEKVKQEVVHAQLRPSLDMIKVDAVDTSIESVEEATRYCDALKHIIADCWVGDPRQRPPFREITARLCTALGLDDRHPTRPPHASDILADLGRSPHGASGSQLMTKLNNGPSFPKMGRSLVSNGLSMDHSVVCEGVKTFTGAIKVTKRNQTGQDNEFLWTCTAHGEIHVYQLYSIEKVRSWSAHDEKIIALVAAPFFKHNAIWSCSKGGRIRVWFQMNMEMLKEFKVPKKCRPVEGMKLITNGKGEKHMWVWAMSFINSHIYVYDTTNFTVVNEIVIERKRKVITALEQMPNRQVWMGFSDGYIRLYNPDTLEFLEWADAFRSEITSFAYLMTEDRGSHTEFQAWGSDNQGWVNVWSVLAVDRIQQLTSSEAHIGARVTHMASCKLYVTENDFEEETEEEEDNEPTPEPTPGLFDDWRSLLEDGEEGEEEEDIEISSPMIEEDLSSDSVEEPFSVNLSSTSSFSERRKVRDVRRRSRLTTTPFLLSGDRDGRVIIWDSQTDPPRPVQEIASQDTHHGPLLGIFPCQDRICMISADRIISVWYPFWEI